MQEIIIDEEFRSLLPELDEETFSLLEESLLKHGCRDPLILWNGILIDGYNRYGICSYHNIPFNTVDKEFDSREEVLIWIITNQVSRRNLSPIQLSFYRGLHYSADKKIITNESGKNQYSEGGAQNGHQPKKTAERLAKQYNVAKNTIRRDSKLAEGITLIGEESPEAKRKILSGEVNINKIKLESLSSAPTDEIKLVATEIEDGTYQRRAPQEPIQIKDDILPEIRQLNVVIKDFANNFNSMFRQLSNGGAVGLKPVLRSYIDQLEDLYRNIK